MKHVCTFIRLVKDGYEYGVMNPVFDRSKKFRRGHENAAYVPHGRAKTFAQAEKQAAALMKDAP